VPFPETVAVPTFVPPEQSDGALGCGPNTLNVIVPDGEAPPDREAEIRAASISLFAVPAVPDDGAATEPKDGEAGPTTVSAIPAPHPESAALLLASPP
jgi:hypothetical protein